MRKSIQLITFITIIILISCLVMPSIAQDKEPKKPQKELKQLVISSDEEKELDLYDKRLEELQNQYNQVLMLKNGIVRGIALAKGFKDVRYVEDRTKEGKRILRELSEEEIAKLSQPKQ